jgi:plastocyanin
MNSDMFNISKIIIIMKTNRGSGKSKLIGVAFLYMIITISYSCSKSTSYDTPTGGGTKGTGPGLNEVWMQDMAFTPATITVSSGTTIRWTNKDQAIHTVTSDAGIFDSGSLGNGGTFNWQFNDVGTFTYHCKFHSMMTGTVVVK